MLKFVLYTIILELIANLKTMKKILFILFCLSSLFTACNNSGIPEIEKQIPEKLETPAGLVIDQATVTSTSFSITWDAIDSNDVSSYQIEYKRSDEEQYTQQSVYSNSCQVTGLSHSSLYYVRLRALSYHGDEFHSDYTSDVEQQTLIVYIVTAPTNVRLVDGKVTSSSLLVEWDAVENAIGYVVTCTAKNTGAEITEFTEQTSVTIRGLDPDTEYDIKVKSRSRSGEEYDSQYSSTLVAKTKMRGGGIFTASDFVAFAQALEAEYAETGTAFGLDYVDESGVVNIKDNIDFAGIELAPISVFTGIIDGNGFTISNLKLSTYGENTGLFATLTDATVRNLNFDDTCAISVVNLSGESHAGVVAGYVGGNCTFENITTAASLSGATIMGGIVGCARLKTGDVLFKNCTNRGAISFPEIQSPADVKIGGICGANEEKVRYEGCTNEGTLSSKSTGGSKFTQIGGIVGGPSDHTIVDCHNKGTLYVDVRNSGSCYIGGIGGRAFRGSAVDCTNTGAVTITDSSTTVETGALYIAGGFGTIEGNNNATNKLYLYKNISNSADIYSNAGILKDTCIGGVVGLLMCVDIDLDGLSNSGNITLTTTVSNSGIAGCIGLFTHATAGKPVMVSKIQNCTNTGNIYFVESRSNSAWIHLAGIVGRTYNNLITIENCVNRGDITCENSTRSNAAGIVSECKCDVSGCTNYGTIYAPDTHVDYYSCLGGIVSRLTANQTITTCKNYGTIIYNGKGFTKANANKGIVCSAGVVALAQYGTVSSSENYGTILSNDYDASYGLASYLNAKGAIVGWGATNAAVTIKDCKVGGAIGSCVETDADMGASKATAITAENYTNYIYGGDAKNGVTVSGCSFAQ